MSNGVKSGAKYKLYYYNIISVSGVKKYFVLNS